MNVSYENPETADEITRFNPTVQGRVPARHPKRSGNAGGLRGKIPTDWSFPITPAFSTAEADREIGLTKR